ncbi:MAG: T9SS type A sorting domain-containing protein [Bacteroidia bacterium]|jgi:hypothetical protein|nr:T9SS type A sorting domain-containing protein [Bacteroidia bacterium]
MTKNIIKIVMGTVICMMAANLYSLSDGGFNVTGAPGEGDCTGCHNASTTNSDPNGSIAIAIDSANGFYEPGKTYPVKVTIGYAGKTRFGFAFTSRQTGSGTYVGSFTANPQSGVVNRTEYVAHTQLGSFANNEQTWQFTWTAPDTIEGDVQFYVAGVAANADNGNTGDLVYTQSLTLKKAGTTSLKQIQLPHAQITLFPNPATDIVYVQQLQKEAIKEAILVNANGKMVLRFTRTAIEESGSNTILHLTDKLPSGVYFLQIKQSHTSGYYKLYIGH